MLTIVNGDLFSQNAECFVNPWNMNFIPWFLLVPHWVSGKLKKVAGYKPFNELLKMGLLKPGSAVITNGGNLSQKIIHVAGLEWYWISTLKVVENCIRNALLLAEKNNIKSIAFPLIGTGVGGLKEKDVLQLMEKVASEKVWSINKIIVVKYQIS